MRTIVGELVRGKGLWRALLYEAIFSSAVALRAPIIDIASGGNPGYWRILGLKKADITTIDVNASTHPSLVYDFSSFRLPYPDASFESAFLMNCVYIFSDPLSVMREVRRILRLGGVALMSFPLVFPYTPEPRDLYRFTEEGVRYLCAESGLVIVALMPLGGRWASAAYLISPFLRPYFIFAFPVYFMTVFLDMVSAFFLPRLSSAPIGYFAIVKKI